MIKFSRENILRILVGLIGLEWAFDLIHRWQHLEEKLLERPTLWDLLRSSLMEALLTLAIVLISLRLLKERPGFLRPSSEPVSKSLREGIFAGFIIFVFSTFVISPWLRSLGFNFGENEALRPLFADLRGLPVWIFLAIFSGGFIEELQRVFTLRIFEESLGKWGLLVGVLLSSVVFGFGHLYQGLNSAINIGLTGLMYSLLYLRKREPLVPMAAHAVFDLVGVVLGFSFLR